MTGRPFSTHEQGDVDLDALYDGVPNWMAGSLNDWLAEMLSNTTYTSHGLADVDIFRALERLLRTSLTNGSSRPNEMYQIIFSKMNSSVDLILDVVDGLLQIGGEKLVYGGSEKLESILLESGSKWKVVPRGGGQFHLEERVDETVSAVMEELVSQGGTASQYLASAWNDAFGRSPNSSTSYSNAIKAVEAASWQVVTPNDSLSTLGSIIRELKDHPDQFEVKVHEKKSNNAIEAIRKSMSVLWDGQTDRHGTSNPVAPSQEASEQVIFIALSLVQQFNRNLVSRL